MYSTDISSLWAIVCTQVALEKYNYISSWFTMDYVFGFLEFKIQEKLLRKLELPFFTLKINLL